MHLWRCKACNRVTATRGCECHGSYILGFDRVEVDIALEVAATKLLEALDRNTLERITSGALRDTVNAHGPITRDLTGSASKRIAAQIEGHVRPQTRYIENALMEVV